VRPLPRLHAVTDDSILADPDVGIGAAAIAAIGPAAALHVRGRNTPASSLAKSAERFMSLAAPAEAAVIINARPALARAVGAQGVQLGAGDLVPGDARKVFSPGWIGRSVHSLTEARAAIAEGADYLMLGSIFETPTHPGATPLGLEQLAAVAALGCPVIAIGGITPNNAGAVKEAGAWGVAAIRALWLVKDRYAAGVAMIKPWSDVN